MAIENKIMPAHFNSGIMTWVPSIESTVPHSNDSNDWIGITPWHITSSTDEKLIDKQTVPIILVACDNKYFKYFPKLFLSIVRLANKNLRKIAIHLHIDDPQDSILFFLKRIIDNEIRCLENIYFSMSVSNLRHKDPSIFTCLRFLCLPDVLSRGYRYNFVFDIDDILGEDFFIKMEQVKDYDCALHMHNFDKNFKQFCGEPWSINASQIYIKSSPKMLDFAQNIKSLIEISYDPKLPTNWTIDQNALGRAYKILARNNENLRVWNIHNQGSFSVMPHTIGGKDALMLQGEVVTIENFEECVISSAKS
jgi:hypothetical protein